ncbi:receptor-type tyrosine-protein phosphatase eta-like [Hoplias malabaricus]|uniref:receptor-type tyrosine-protein phosphatase eta-like n=1 Tax=Hoplias malabaricus TaxID=27720 RepID=UPI0034624C6B
MRKHSDRGTLLPTLLSLSVLFQSFSSIPAQQNNETVTSSTVKISSSQITSETSPTNNSITDATAMLGTSIQGSVNTSTGTPDNSVAATRSSQPVTNTVSSSASSSVTSYSTIGLTSAVNSAADVVSTGKTVPTPAFTSTGTPDNNTISVTAAGSSQPVTNTVSSSAASSVTPYSSTGLTSAVNSTTDVVTTGTTVPTPSFTNSSTKLGTTNSSTTSVTAAGSTQQGNTTVSISANGSVTSQSVSSLTTGVTTGTAAQTSTVISSNLRTADNTTSVTAAGNYQLGTSQGNTTVSNSSVTASGLSTVVSYTSVVVTTGTTVQTSTVKYSSNKLATTTSVTAAGSIQEGNTTVSSSASSSVTSQSISPLTTAVTTGTTTQTTIDLNVTNLSVSARNTSSVSLNWNVTQGNSYLFNVQWNNGTVNISVNTSSVPYTVSNLSPGINYTFTVTAFAANNSTAGAPARISAFTVPYNVTDLRVSARDTSSVSLIWKLTQGNYSYFSVQWNNSIVNMTANTSSMSYTVIGLTAAENYTFTVTAVSGDNSTVGAPAQISAFTNPNAVTDLHVSAKSTSSVSLTWNLTQGNYSYFSVQWNNSTVNITANTSSMSYTVNDLTPGVNYTFTVNAFAADNITSGAPNQTSVFTIPYDVTGLSISARNTSSVSLIWKLTQGNYSYFSVQWNNSIVTITANTSSMSYTVNDLTPGVNYTFTVTAVAGDSTVGAPDQISAFTKPDVVTNLTFVDKTTSSVSLNWTLLNGNSSFYRLEWNSGNATSQVTSYNVSGLNAGENYTFSVTAVAGDNSTSGAPAQNSTFTRPDKISNLTVFNVTMSSVSLNWNKPNGMFGFFLVQWSTDNITLNKTTQYTSFYITALLPGFNYTFGVLAVAADNFTNGSMTALSSCTGTSPVVTYTCEGPNRTNALLQLTWQKPLGHNQGYIISLGNGIYNNSTIMCDSVCNYNISGLQYNYQYNVTITTLGCGQSGRMDFGCTTGVTYPPVPTKPIDLEIQYRTENTAKSTVTVQFSDSLLNGSNGPILYYGVLLTTDQTSNSSTSDVIYTYNDWKSKTSQAYLTVLVKNPNIRSNFIQVNIGDNDNVINGTNYTNAPLDPNTYRAAILLVTNLKITNGIVDLSHSIVAITPFASSIIIISARSTLSIIGIILGVLSVLLILCIVIIIVVIRMRGQRKNSDTGIPVTSLSSIPVRVEEYEGYFRKQHADSNCGFAEEYEDLRDVGTAQSKTNALALENKTKNRYNNVLPYDSSRVKLSVQGTSCDDYINANYIAGYNSRKEYIAAQGPLPATVNEFWRMIWENHIQTIVMLTRCNEQGRVKCEKYWPTEIKMYGNILVKNTSEITLEDWTITDFTIKNVKTAEIREVRHFHFTAWPDHGVPETTEVLINFRHLVREHMDQYSLHSPTVVHCSAGVGRTGTFIALDHLTFQIERESMVDIYGIVYDMRMHRSLMVQTEDQYVFLNQCALDIIKSRMGTNVDLIYQNTAAFSIYGNM